MVGWHYRLNGHEFEQTPGDSEGQEAWLVAVHEVAKSWTRLSPWRRPWHPTPVLLPGKSHGGRSLVGCGPWGH